MHWKSCRNVKPKLGVGILMCLLVHHRTAVIHQCFLTLPPGSVKMCLHVVGTDTVLPSFWKAELEPVSAACLSLSLSGHSCWACLSLDWRAQTKALIEYDPENNSLTSEVKAMERHACCVYFCHADLPSNAKSNQLKLNRWTGTTKAISCPSKTLYVIFSFNSCNNMKVYKFEGSVHLHKQRCLVSF